MFSVFGMCFNWKVLLGIGVVIVGVLVIAPGLLVSALPLLLLAACPLSMLFMTRGGHGHGISHGAHQETAAPSKESLEQRLEVLAEEQRKLQAEIRELDSDRAPRPTEHVGDASAREARV